MLIIKPFSGTIYVGTTKNSIMKMNFEEEYSTIMQVSGFLIFRQITEPLHQLSNLIIIRDTLTLSGDLLLRKRRIVSLLQEKDTIFRKPLLATE